MLKNITLNLCCQFTRFGLQKLGKGIVSGLSNERDQLDQWQCSLKRLFHVAKCTDYVMMVTGRAHSPLYRTSDQWLPFLSGPYLFFADRVALSVFSNTVAHAKKVCEGGMHFKIRVSHFLNFWGLWLVIWCTMWQFSIPGGPVDRFWCLKRRFGTLKGNFGTWWRHRGSGPPGNHITY